MKVTKRLIASIFEIVIGTILTILGYTGVVDSYWSGMGTALTVVGVIFLVRTFRYKRNTEYKEKVDAKAAIITKKYPVQDHAIIRRYLFLSSLTSTSTFSLYSESRLYRKVRNKKIIPTVINAVPIPLQ